jgi:hypothetical protein
VTLAGKLRLLALQHLPLIRKFILYEQYYTIKPISILIPQLHTVAAKESIFAAAKVSSSTTAKAPVTFTFAPCVTPAQLRVALRNLRHFRLALDDAERVHLQFDHVEKLVDYAEENNWRVSEVFDLVSALYNDHTIAIINHWVGVCSDGPRPMLGNFGPAASAVHKKACTAAIIRDPDDVDPLWYGSLTPASAPPGAAGRGAGSVADGMPPPAPRTPAPWHTKLSHLNPHLNNVLGMKVCDAFRTRSTNSCPKGDQCKKVCYKTASCPRYQPSAPVFGQLFARE